jgi:hypothetical protein
MGNAAPSMVDRTAITRTVAVGDNGVAITLGKRARKAQGTDLSDSTEDIWSIEKTVSFDDRSDVVHQERASASSSGEEDR